MTDLTKDLIDSYVDDVARRLPGKQRNDVAFELRALLGEELAAKAASAGREADAAMTRELLGAFGDPAEVAELYQPEGWVIVRSSETRGFALTALIGVAVQWALTLPAVFRQAESFEGQVFSRLGGWWTTWGLGAFWWPGVMVVLAIVARWIGHTWPRTPRAWAPPRMTDRDRVDPWMMGPALAAWAAAAALWIAMPWVSPSLPGALPRVLAFDPVFLHERAACVLPLWLGHFGVHVAALAQGRWRPLTRRLSLGFGVAICALLIWWVFAGPVFTAKATDDAAKGLAALIVIISAIAAAADLYREQARLHRPSGLPQA
jgi:hypothetical protein